MKDQPLNNASAEKNANRLSIVIPTQSEIQSQVEKAIKQRDTSAFKLYIEKVTEISYLLELSDRLDDLKLMLMYKFVNKKLERSFPKSTDIINQITFSEQLEKKLNVTELYNRQLCTDKIPLSEKNEFCFFTKFNNKPNCLQLYILKYKKIDLNEIRRPFDTSSLLSKFFKRIFPDDMYIKTVETDYVLYFDDNDTATFHRITDAENNDFSHPVKLDVEDYMAKLTFKNYKPRRKYPPKDPPKYKH